MPQRGFLLALPVGLLLLWSWRRRLLRGEPGLRRGSRALLWGALPLVHLHTFLFVSLLFAVWTVGGRPLAGGDPGARPRGAARRLGDLAGDRRLRACVARRLEPRLDDRGEANPSSSWR